MTKNKPATPEQMDAAYQMHVGDGMSISAVGRALGRSRETVKDWIKKARDDAKARGETPPTGADLEKIRLRDKVNELEAIIRTAQRETITTRSVRREILKLAEFDPTPPTWLSEKIPSSTVTGVPVAFWSDWHWGEVVDPAQINGVNEYNLTIARARVRTLIEKTIDLCMNHMVDAKYPGIVIALGGDMVSGDIHQELSETNETPMMPALLDLFGVLIAAIGRMADVFGRVFLPCVAGNHARNTHRPRAKGYNHTNFDWLLYSLLERHFQDDSRVTFQVPDGADAYFKIYERRFLLTHGNNIGVKGGDGIIGALGPILRGDTKIRQSSASINMPFDILMMGHWHQYMPLPRVIVNGSIKGYDEFLKLFLRVSPEAPSQSLFFVHPEYGVTYHCPVFVQAGVYKPAAGTSWVSWTE